MDEQFCDLHNGITLCYETFGERSDPTALLIMGLGTQMVAWHEDFCRQLAAEGFHVVRFDNRDIGHSTHVKGASMGGMIAQTLAAQHPGRVLSLTSIMSNTGALSNGQPALKLYPFFLRRPAPGRDAYVSHFER